MQFWSPNDEHICSKNVEAWNKLIVKQKFCASSWLITEINKLRCTVSKTLKLLKKIQLKAQEQVEGQYYAWYYAIGSGLNWLRSVSNKASVSQLTVLDFWVLQSALVNEHKLLVTTLAQRQNGYSTTFCT